MTWRMSLTLTIGSWNFDADPKSSRIDEHGPETWIWNGIALDSVKIWTDGMKNCAEDC